MSALAIAPAFAAAAWAAEASPLADAVETRGRDSRQIICFGGNLGAADNPLYDYVLASTRTPQPRVCLLVSRRGASELVELFYRAFQEPRCRPSHILVGERGRGREPESHLGRQDVILVAGGSLIRVLGSWHVHGIDKLLRRAWRGGTVLCGFRGGALCWFEEAVTTFDGQLRASRGLGFLPYSGCVHYGQDPARRVAYRSHLLRGMRPGYAVEEGVALHFIGTQLHAAVSAASGGRAFSLRAQAEEIVEEQLPVTHLRVEDGLGLTGLGAGRG